MASQDAINFKPLWVCTKRWLRSQAQCFDTNEFDKKTASIRTTTTNSIQSLAKTILVWFIRKILILFWKLWDQIWRFYAYQSSLNVAQITVNTSKFDQI